jgi:hypothetical protein
MLKTGGILTLSKGSWRNIQCLWWPLHGIPSKTPLKNNTTLLEATRTSAPYGPPYVKKGTRQYQISPIFSIPYAPNWVSKTLSIIWCSNTMVFFIDTFKQKWISQTSLHWAQLIDTLSRSSRNLRRNDESLDLKTPHNRSKEKALPTHTARDQVEMVTLRKTSPSNNIRREMRRQRRTRENGVSTIKFLGTTPKNVAPSNPLCSRSRLLSQRSILILSQILKEGSGLSMLNPVPLSLPPKSDQVNQKNQRKGNASFTRRCGSRGIRFISLLTVIVRRT